MPLSSSAFRLRTGKRKRFCAMIDSFFPLSSRAFSIASHSSRDAAMGFSHTTFFPLFSALIDISA